MSKISNDEGPTLREEKNYKDFYPELKEDELLPVIIKENNIIKK